MANGYNGKILFVDLKNKTHEVKAIAVCGTGKLAMAEPDKVREIAQWHRKRIKSHPPNVGFSKFGTPGMVKC